jgi:exoribonuclease-2
MHVAEDGTLQRSDIGTAMVRNHAKLAYNSVAAWIDGTGTMPSAIGGVKGLAENITLQHRVAQKLKTVRHQHGALDLDTIEVRPVFVGDEIKDLKPETNNVANDIIQDFMLLQNI